MRRAWVMGWAVPEAWFSEQVRAVFPEDRHVFFEPGDAAVDALEREGPFDSVAGYSLGAHLLLAAAERVTRLGVPVTLLAPFGAFPSEEGLGGRVARPQVRYLARWVRRDREAALADFYARAELDVEARAADGITAETLAEGLAKLEQGRIDGPVPEGWRMFAGDQDGLLDAVALKRQWPSLSVVTGAGHHPAALLRAWREAGN